MVGYVVSSLRDSTKHKFVTRRTNFRISISEFVRSNRFSRGVHSVLRHFVDATRRRFLANAVKVVERPGAFADGKPLFDGLGYVGFSEQHSVAQGPAACQLSGNG